MVKNEQDVIEPFLRHNRPFFDAMVLLDNGSSDLTPEITRNCSKELGGIFFTPFPDHRYLQSEFMTSALQYVQAAFFADFVCFLDADEFISAETPEQFHDRLKSIPIGEASSHNWETYLPDPTMPGGQSDDFLDYMTFRRKQELPQYKKVFMRLGGGTEPDLVVRQGNHGLINKGVHIQETLIEDIPLRHFPIRSGSQILTKGAVSWLANLARHDNVKHDDVASQWKRLFEFAMRGESDIPPAVLAEEALAYAQDDVPKDFADNAERFDHGIRVERSFSRSLPTNHFRTIALSLMQRHQREEEFAISRADQSARQKTGIESAFDSEWHWQNLFLDVPPFRYLAEKYSPASVFDIGCGHGLYLELFRKLGCPDVFGVDGIDLNATVLDGKTYATVDLQKPFEARRTYDIVLCLEVAEHIEPDATDVLFDTIARHARELIVFSMAEPGQPGNGHINCRTIDDVLLRWKARGWKPDLVETLGLRALSTMSWFRRNIVVLKRCEPDEVETQSSLLIRIGQMQYVWYGQEPGVRQIAFKEHFPPSTVGYGRVVRQ